MSDAGSADSWDVVAPSDGDELDVTHFRVVRPRHVTAFTLVPAQLP